MKKRVNNFKGIFLDFFGIFYLIIAIIAFYNSVALFGGSSILWFSYYAFLIIGIGILIRNSSLIASQLNIILIPYIVWSLDFFYRLFTSRSLWGITDYVFSSQLSLSQLVTIQHVIIVPVALIAIYFIKLKRKDFWKISLMQIIILFILTRIFSNYSENINCAFRNCLSFEISGPYILTWFITYLLMIFAVNFLLIKINIFKFKSKKIK